MDNRPIGIFDSGVGGLTVANAISKQLPNETICYVGDTARVPYGNKSKKSILMFSKQITSWLVNQNCKVIIIACNTASSLALDTLKLSVPIPILGVIDPGVKWALSTTKNNNIGVLGTRATINSKIYNKRIKEKNEGINVFEKACPLFVPLVEEGFIEGEIPSLISSFYLKDIKKTKIDTLILGCTHYPLLTKTIINSLSQSIRLIDSSSAVSNELKILLKRKNLISNNNNKGKIICYVTDYTKTFENVVNQYFKFNISAINRLDVF